MQEVCRKVGLSQELTDDLIGQIKTDRIKEELKRTTQEALDLGVSEHHCTLGLMQVELCCSPVGIWCSIHCGSYGWQEGGLLWQ